MTEQPESPDTTKSVVTPTPPKIPLHSADHIRVEMAKIYREMRAGTLDVKKGCSFIFALGQIAKMLEMSIVEKRLEQLERTVEG